MTENNQTKEKLLAEIGRLKKELKKKKKYGLVWDSEREPEEVVEMCKEKLPILKEVKSKQIVVDRSKPINLLIEGDNYHALSVLNYTHKGKIDVIYIDPPYNTGNKDFKYNDRFIDKEDGYRHSKWLNFMEKRLKLAKNLLKDSGVLFVSIDDNEFQNLRLLVDKVFVEKNVEIMVWRKSGDGRYGKMKNTTTFRNDHEYVLVAYKNKTKSKLSKIKIYPNFNSKPKKEGDRYYWVGYIARGERGTNKSHKNYYSVKDPNGKTFSAQFELNKEEFLELDKNGGIYWTKSGIPYRKIYTDEHREIVCSSMLLDVGGTYEGKIDINNVFGIKETKDAPFNNPKPVALIKRLLDLSTLGNEIILDFMAGSGTTGQAVLEFNEECGGDRQFILCTNDEELDNDRNSKKHKICSDICYPRIEKIINGYKNSKGEKVEGLGGNLKYFKTDFVDYKESTDKNKIKLTKEAVEMLCIKEGTFESVLNSEYFKIFKNPDHYTGIIFDQLAIEDFKKEIKDIKGKISVYIFSLGDDSFEDEFGDIKQKVKLSPIPEAILKVYRRIYR